MSLFRYHLFSAYLSKPLKATSIGDILLDDSNCSNNVYWANQIRRVQKNPSHQPHVYVLRLRLYTLNTL